MSKHTPGPWRIECFEVTAGPPDGFDPIWTCGCCGGYAMAGDPLEAIANGRLIAAAPELLEACRLIVAYDESDPEDGMQMMANYVHALDAARAAIAKAEAKAEGEGA